MNVQLKKQKLLKNSIVRTRLTVSNLYIEKTNFLFFKNELSVYLMVSSNGFSADFLNTLRLVLKKYGLVSIQINLKDLKNNFSKANLNIEIQHLNELGSGQFFLVDFSELFSKLKHIKIKNKTNKISMFFQIYNIILNELVENKLTKFKNNFLFINGLNKTVTVQTASQINKTLFNLEKLELNFLHVNVVKLLNFLNLQKTLLINLLHLTKLRKQ